MSDIYHIPGDDGKTYRLKKFVEYQHGAQSVDNRFLAEYARSEGLSKDKIVDMAFLHCILYNEITTILLLEMNRQYSYRQIWKQANMDLNIGSARKHTRYNDTFEILIEEYGALTAGKQWESVKKLLTDNPVANYRTLYSWISSIHGIGRFSADLFCEILLFTRDQLGMVIEQPPELDWADGFNLTAGIFNIFYEDERANAYDKTHRVTKSEELYLNKKLVQIQKEIQKVYPEDSEITVFIGKICSFRNLFKGARYGGFHHDRQLSVIRNYEKTFPEYGDLWKKCYEIRSKIYPHKLLGELNGWDGVRPERKKLWLTTGNTGVE